MGLALHNSGDSETALSELAEHRHIPVRRRGSNGHQLPKSRLPGRRKFFNWGVREDSTTAFDAEVPNSSRPPLPLSEYQLRALASTYRGSRDSNNHASLSEAATWRLRDQGRWRKGLASEVREGEAIARSDSFRTPRRAGDGGLGRFPATAHGRRPPSLEREEAFRDANTCKRRRSWDDAFVSPHDGRSNEHDDEEFKAAEAAEEVAELYRLGLLYDDEHLRGEGFGLDMVMHQEPAYTLDYSTPRSLQDRRRRKHSHGHNDASGTAALGGTATNFSPLQLELSFRALGEDDAFADYLISPDEEEFAAASEAGSDDGVDSEHGQDQRQEEDGDGAHDDSHDISSNSISHDISQTQRQTVDVSTTSTNTHSFRTNTNDNDTTPSHDDKAAAVPDLIPDEDGEDDDTASNSSSQDWSDHDDNKKKGERGQQQQSQGEDESDSDEGRGSPGWIMVD